MKKTFLFISTLCLLLLLSACKSTEQRNTQNLLESAPEWYNQPPTDTEEFLYATGTFIGQRRSSAERSAFIQARSDMASKLSIKVETLEKLFEDEVGSGTSANYSSMFSFASQQVTSQELRGVDMDRRECNALPDGRIECFVLANMPVGTARAALENALSRDEELYVRFRESEAFKELEENLERLGMD